jgi:hypothetical protein
MVEPRPEKDASKEQRGGGDQTQRHDQQQRKGEREHQPGQRNRQSDQDGGKR